MSPARTQAVGVRLEAIAVGEVTDDGRLDLVVGDFLADQVVILPGKGDGTFHDPITAAVGRHPNWVQLADLDGDGDDDIVTVNFRGGDISILRHDVAGFLQPAISYAAGGTP